MSISTFSMVDDDDFVSAATEDKLLISDAPFPSFANWCIFVCVCVFVLSLESLVVQKALMVKGERY
jgi:hypothetical protein